MTIHELIAMVQVERLQYNRFRESVTKLREELKTVPSWQKDKLKKAIDDLQLGTDGQKSLVSCLQDMIEEHEDYIPKNK